jgi:5'-phosphate synthase pdxT subunit
MPSKSARSTIGVLALQGDFNAHQKMLLSLPDIDTVTVRSVGELSTVDALILPGGESTTVAKLLIRSGLMQPLRDRLVAGMPAYGTCAGLILLAKTIVGRPEQPTIGALKVSVDRNAFGRQVDSFEADIPFPLPADSEASVRGVFIRAPYVESADDGVDVLARFEDRVVAVRHGAILATAFHPELTDDNRVHAYFASIVSHSREKR